MEKSPDAFRTISEVADLLDVPAHVLRFWESRFPQIRPVKRAGGRRYYRPADVALLSGIRRLLHEDGMTIRGVQKVLREKGVRHVSGLQEDPVEDVADDLAPAPAPAPEPAEVIQLADRLAAPVDDTAPVAATVDDRPAQETPVAEVMAEAAGHWPADPAEADDPETAADAAMPQAWNADPDDPAPEVAPEPEPEMAEAPAAPLILEPAAAQPEPAPAPVLPDVPFDPAIADAPFHVASRLRAADPADFAGRRAALAALHTRLSALRSALGPGAGKMRN